MPAAVRQVFAFSANTAAVHGHLLVRLQQTLPFPVAVAHHSLTCGVSSACSHMHLDFIHAGVHGCSCHVSCSFLPAC